MFCYNLWTMSNIKRIHSNLYLASNPEATADFYRALGFDVNFESGTVRIKLNDFTLAFMDEKQAEIDNETGVVPKGAGIYTYVETADVDRHYEAVKANGVVPSSEPKDWSWGKREFAVKDPDGYKIIFYTPVKS